MNTLELLSSRAFFKILVGLFWLRLRLAASVSIAIAFAMAGSTSLPGVSSPTNKHDNTFEKCSNGHRRLWNPLMLGCVFACMVFFCGCTVVTSDMQATSGDDATAAQTVASVPAAGEESPSSSDSTSYKNTDEDEYIPSVVLKQDMGYGITLARLDNGLTVIVEQSHLAPVVSVLFQVKAGGIYEDKWLGCGLSHLLEHLVAKGATRGAGHVEASKESRSRIDAIGAQSNAYTSDDNTTYFINCAASRAQQAIEILADWMARPDITVADYQREHGVVQRELEMGKDDSRRVMWYTHSRNFYRDHPASVPVIGYPDVLKNVTYEDVLAYHAKMYAPDRMVFVVAGDVEVDKTLEWVCQSLAGFQSTRTQPVVLPQVPLLSATRRVETTSELFKDTSEYISFRTIELEDPDLYALDVLSTVIGSGRSSLLHRQLVRQQQLATEVSSSSYTPDWGAGNFLISFRSEPANADAAEAAIIEQIKDLQENPISDESLSIAKSIMKASFVYGQQDVASRSRRIAGDYLSTGDPNFSRHYTERIDAVTAADIQQMAIKYLDTNAMAITRISPAGSEQAADDKKADQSENAQATVFTLDNGLRVILQPSDTVEITTFAMATKGGLLAEDPETNGLGMLMTQLSTHGTAGENAKNALEIAAFFEGAGGSGSAICGHNTFLWQASVLSEYSEQAMELCGDIITNPAFGEMELEILRPRILAAIRSTEENSRAKMSQYYYENFYAGTPWAMQTAGSEDVVASATVADIRAHYKKWINAGSTTIAVYGNFDPDKMRQIIEKKFSAMSPRTNTVASFGPREIAPEGETHTLETSYQQATVMMGWPGVTFDSPDKDALTVLETILSGYGLPSGPLHNRLRGQQLVYMVHAVNRPGLNPGSIIAMATTQPDKVDTVVNTIIEIMQSSTEMQFTQQQIDQAVNTIVTADLLESQDISSIATQAALFELYGLGYDYPGKIEQRLRAITPEDLHRVANKYLSTKPLITITTPTPQTSEN